MQMCIAQDFAVVHEHRVYLPSPGAAAGPDPSSRANKRVNDTRPHFSAMRMWILSKPVRMYVVSSSSVFTLFVIDASMKGTITRGLLSF